MLKSLKIFFVFIGLVLFISCRKDYSLEGGGLSANGTWSFSDQTLTPYDGNIDTAYISVSSGKKILHLQGPSLLGGQQFNLDLYTLGSFQPGSYKVSTSEADFSLATVNKTIYQSDLIAGEFTVNITNIGNNNVSGNFSGVADDSTGKTRNIVSGLFSSTIDLSSNSSSVSVGTLGNSAGACSPGVVNGTYTQGVALTSTNNVVVQVNVVTPGTYSINTNTVNGVSFSATGNFTSTGNQSVTLNGTGTPVGAGSKSYTVSYGTSTCTFNVPFN